MKSNVDEQTNAENDFVEALKVVAGCDLEKGVPIPTPKPLTKVGCAHEAWSYTYMGASCKQCGHTVID